jgi:hypothetical protein
MSAACALLAVAATPAAALTPEELFEKLSPSIFVIHTWDHQGKWLALGSGVVVGREQVITNCHVLRQASAIAIRRGNVSYGAELEFPDPERDLCQLKVKELAAPPVTLGDMAAVRIGQRVYAIGSPRGLELTLTEGLVSSLRGGDDDNQPIIQTSAAISPGSSGGGLFDAAGRLIGITTFQRRDGQQLNFAHPVDWVREVPSRGKEALAKRKALEEARAAASNSGAPGVALAPYDPTLPREMPQPGDSWTYVALDLMYRPNDRSRKFVHTVRSVNRSAIVEVVMRDGAQVAQEAFSPDLNAVYHASAEVLEVAPFVTAFRTLQAGERWGPLKVRGIEAIGTAVSTGEVPYAFESARVVGSEQVSVAAGSFDAMRVELDGRVSNVLLGGSAVIRGYTSFRQTVWYAPKVKRVVKLVMETPRFATAYELESYSVR